MRNTVPEKRDRAEGERFELSVEVYPLRRFSKPLVSTTHPPLQFQRFTKAIINPQLSIDNRQSTSLKYLNRLHHKVLVSIRPANLSAEVPRTQAEGGRDRKTILEFRYQMSDI